MAKSEVAYSIRSLKFGGVVHVQQVLIFYHLKTRQYVSTLSNILTYV